MEKSTMSVPEAGAALSVSRATSYRLARSGEIAGVPVLRVGRQLRVSRRALERILNSYEKEAKL